ncbi:MAG: AtpZ/AtpI family protein [Bacteroidetes bacterium]|nr:AtpZ/AtpI family protein [Bacteroidota bacterium]
MQNQKQPNLFFKYSNLALQMGIIIGLSAWGGQKLDTHYKNKTPVFTIVLSLSGIALALYLVLKDVIKPKNEDD